MKGCIEAAILCAYFTPHVAQLPPRQEAQGLDPLVVMALEPALPMTMGPPVTKDPVDMSFLTWLESQWGHLI
ncbi:hypothetical protein DPF_1903 [Desulfoplanes formicivorans]|uniref:Uncharacterized protein n=1 Tax=Desulfoplanes formicivorans TaxID=1592317 RepID=A0A194AIN2_9BACT|nr:hypothetical protein DPF_1903 [Desulfoplanes formicivorans]